MGRLGAGVAAAQTGLVCGLCVAPLPRLRLLGDARQLPGIRAAFIILHTYLSVCITPLAEVSSTVMDNRNIHPVFYSLGLKPVITVLFSSTDCCKIIQTSWNAPRRPIPVSVYGNATNSELAFKWDLNKWKMNMHATAPYTVLIHRVLSGSHPL